MNTNIANTFNEDLLKNLFIEELVFMLFLAMVATIILLITNYKLKKENNRILEYSINVNAKINEEIPQILEDMTHECFDEYMLLNRAYKDKEYITDEEETKIMKDVGNMVVERLSPAAIDKLSTYYNKNMLAEIISNKVYILVMGYAAENNQLPNEKIEG